MCSSRRSTIRRRKSLRYHLATLLNAYPSKHFPKAEATHFPLDFFLIASASQSWNENAAFSPLKHRWPKLYVSRVRTLLMSELGVYYFAAKRSALQSRASSNPLKNATCRLEAHGHIALAISPLIALSPSHLPAPGPVPI